MHQYVRCKHPCFSFSYSILIKVNGCLFNKQLSDYCGSSTMPITEADKSSWLTLIHYKKYYHKNLYDLLRKYIGGNDLILLEKGNWHPRRLHISKLSLKEWTGVCQEQSFQTEEKTVSPVTAKGIENAEDGKWGWVSHSGVSSQSPVYCSEESLD